MKEYHIYTSDDQFMQQLWVWLHAMLEGGSITSFFVGEDQGMSTATCHLNHSGLLRLDKRQSHRGGFQHVVIALNCREAERAQRESARSDILLMLFID